MISVVVILTAMSLTAPVHCYQNQAAWNQRTDNAGLARTTRAYYDPNNRTIGLAPYTCKLVLQPTLEGATVLAHELAHVWQDDQDRPFNEAEADRIANITDRPLLRRLAKTLGRRAAVFTPDRPIVLSP